MKQKLRAVLITLRLYILQAGVLGLIYTPAHILWGDPLNSVMPYYLFGVIAGLSGAYILRHRSFFFLLLPMILAGVEGNFVRKYVAHIEWERIRPFLTKYGGFWEWDSVSIRDAARLETLIAPACAAVIMIITRILVRRQAKRDALLQARS